MNLGTHIEWRCERPVGAPESFEVPPHLAATPFIVEGVDPHPDGRHLIVRTRTTTGENAAGIWENDTGRATFAPESLVDLRWSRDSTALYVLERGGLALRAWPSGVLRESVPVGRSGDRLTHLFVSRGGDRVAVVLVDEAGDGGMEIVKTEPLRNHARLWLGGELAGELARDTENVARQEIDRAPTPPPSRPEDVFVHRPLRPAEDGNVVDLGDAGGIARWRVPGSELVLVRGHRLAIVTWPELTELRACELRFGPGEVREVDVSRGGELAIVSWLVVSPWSAGYELVDLDAPSQRFADGYRYARPNPFAPREVLRGPVFSPSGRYLVSAWGSAAWWHDTVTGSTARSGTKLVGSVRVHDIETDRVNTTWITAEIPAGWSLDAREDPDAIARPRFVDEGTFEVVLPTGEVRRFELDEVSPTAPRGQPVQR